jgi:hypothetical protein
LPTRGSTLAPSRARSPFKTRSRANGSRVLLFEASAGEGRLEKIMLKQQAKAKYNQPKIISL